MTINEFLRILWRGAIVIVLCAALGVGLALALRQTQQPVFGAHSQVLMSVKMAANTGEALEQADLLARTQVHKGKALATQSVVLDEVVRDLELDESVASVAASMNVEVVSGTSVLNIEVTRDSPQEAADIANAVASTLVEQMKRMSSTDDSGIDSPLEGTITNIAEPAASPVPRATNTDIAALGAAGLAVGALAVLTVHAARTRRTARR